MIEEMRLRDKKLGKSAMIAFVPLFKPDYIKQAMCFN